MNAKLSTVFLRRRILFFAALALAIASRADARQSYGVYSQTIWVGASEFSGLGVGDQLVLAAGTTSYRRAAANGQDFDAPLRLPAGALLDSMRCFFYSDGDTSRINLSLLASDFDTVDDTETGTLLENVTVAQGIGYHAPAVNGFPSLYTTVRYWPVDTVHRFYFLRLFAIDAGDYFRGCQVTWHRQIKPHPGQTFGDVAVERTDHDAIEAFAAAGISDGCDGGANFCPDEPVTRAQLALFLARALGLHWGD